MYTFGSATKAWKLCAFRAARILAFEINLMCGRRCSFILPAHRQLGNQSSVFYFFCRVHVRNAVDHQESTASAHFKRVTLIKQALDITAMIRQILIHETAFCLLPQRNLLLPYFLLASNLLRVCR